MQSSSITLNPRTSSHRAEIGQSVVLDPNLHILKLLSDGFLRHTVRLQFEGKKACPEAHARSSGILFFLYYFSLHDFLKYEWCVLESKLPDYGGRVFRILVLVLSVASVPQI